MRHNPKLKRAWNKAEKRSNKWGCVVLDMRFKTSRNFMKEFANYIQNGIQDSDLDELTGIINHANT